MNIRSKKLRLTVWIIAAIGAGLGQLIWLEWMKAMPTARSGWRFEFAYAAVVASLAVIAGLLYTTTADAIRLPRSMSELVIVGAVIAMALPGAEFLPVTIARLLFSLSAFILFRVHGISPWWVVIVAWFPAVH